MLAQRGEQRREKLRVRDRLEDLVPLLPIEKLHEGAPGLVLRELGRERCPRFRERDGRIPPGLGSSDRSLSVHRRPRVALQYGPAPRRARP
jgi:hypothetical protein